MSTNAFGSARTSDMSTAVANAETLLQTVSIRQLEDDTNYSSALSSGAFVTRSNDITSFHPNDLQSYDALLRWVMKSDQPQSLENGKQIFLPLQRPYPALAHTGEPVDIEAPTTRPNIEDLLPAATLTLADFAAREALPEIKEAAV